MAATNSINTSQMLQTGAILHGTYRIDSYLSSGGFGNTYVVTHIKLNQKRALKEFFMKDVSERDADQTSVRVSNPGKQEEFNDQREKFCKEAQRLSMLHNANIVKVYDLFDENGTSYYVMDLINGESLKEKLEREDKPMSEAQVLGVLRQLLDALQEVHSQGLWHMDLKPGNIMIDQKGVVRLIDFGASKQFDASKGGAVSTSAISFTKGYAPLEQMDMKYDKFGPWTDIYALGATLYCLLTNQRPPMPSDIHEDLTEDKHIALPFPENISPRTRHLIRWMMKTNRLERPQSTQEIRDYLDNKPEGKKEEKKDNHNGGNEGVVIVQGTPGPVIAAAMSTGVPSGSQPLQRPDKPDSHMGRAIISALLFPPTGIYAIYCASQVGKHYGKQQYALAEQASRKAKKWSSGAIVTGLVIWALVALILAIPDTETTPSDTDDDDLSEWFSTDDATKDNSNVEKDYELEKQLEAVIDEMRNELPMDMEDGLSMTGIRLSNDCLTFIVECVEDDDFDIDMLSSVKSEIEKEISKELINQANDDEDYREMLDICKQTHRDIAFKYVGLSSGKSCTVRVPYSDL